jgi:hypothetical protein
VIRIVEKMRHSALTRPARKVLSLKVRRNPETATMTPFVRKPALAYSSLLVFVASSTALGCSGDVVPTKSGSAGAAGLGGSASGSGSGGGASGVSGTVSGSGSGAGYCSGSDSLGGNCTVGAGGVSGGGTGGSATAGGCTGAPTAGVCANGVTVAGTYAVVSGQCVVEYNCPVSAGCQQGAACAPGFVCEESPAAGCGLGCKCTSAGYFDCSSDCPSPDDTVDGGAATADATIDAPPDSAPIQACSIDSNDGVVGTGSHIGGPTCYPSTDLPVGSCSGQTQTACSFCALPCGADGPRQFYVCSCSALGQWTCSLTDQDSTACPEPVDDASETSGDD